MTGRCLIVSILIHLSFLIAWPSNSAKHEKRQGNGKIENLDDGDRELGTNQIKLKLGPIKGAEGSIQELGVGKNGEPCYQWFGGVGLTHDGYGTITEVYRGYVAERAGLRKGDYIPDLDLVMGEVGTPVTFHYIRNKVQHELTVKREKICTRQ